MYCPATPQATRVTLGVCSTEGAEPQLRGQVMKEFTKYVGLDVHKETIAVSVAEAGGGEVRYIGEISNTPEAIKKLVRQLKKGDAQLSLCYEAGPCGYGIYRQLREMGFDCVVVAPSLIPKQAGDRGKTARR